MLRKLGLGFTALAMMTPAMAVALGVGEYELNSYLNQPLDMEVSLHEVGDLSAEEILVNLAPQSEFDAAGVERSYFLNRLAFSVEMTGKDDAILRVTTDQPVREPYLNFLVEFLWPTGRLMREYTVLLDPPSFSDSVTTSVPSITRAPAPVVSSQPAPTYEPEPTPAPAPAAPAETYTAPEPSAASSGSRDTYTVKASDTMWRVALNTRPANSVSVQQMLVAIQEMNPDAFINNNVNLVREGTVLRIPNEQEVRAVSTRNALVEVADQNRKWRDMLEERGMQVPTQQRAQLDGSRQVADSDTEDQGPGSGQVKLVAPESTDSVADGDSTGSAEQGSANTAVLENELAIRDENLDRLDRENAELKSRLADLESQSETSEQLLQLRNDQITQLQEELRKLREAQGVEAPADDPLTAPVEDISEAPASEPELSADDEAAVADANSDDASTAEAGDDAMGEETSLEAELAAEDAEGEAQVVEDEAAEQADATDAQDAAVAVTEAPEVVKPEPAQPQPAPQQQAGIVELLMENLLYIALGALAILLLVFLVLRRKKQDDEPVEEGALFDEFDDESQDDFGLHLEDDVADSSDGADSEGDSGHAPQDSNLDPMEDVEVYVAYGRYPQAVDFLRNEINKHPERDDLKVRLLELLKETNDDAGFGQQVTAFAGVSPTVDEAIARLGGDVSAAPASAVDDELSLDDLEMGLSSDLDETSIPTMETDTSEEPEQESAGRASVADELGDFDFELDGSDELSGDETLILDEDEADSADFSLDVNDGADSADEMSDADRQSLGASPVLNLDDVSSATLDDSDTNYGDLDLNDMSAEFTDMGDDSATASAPDELDLSLDDLDLDGDGGDAAADASSDDTLADLDIELDEAEKSLGASAGADSLDDITAFDLDEAGSEEASLEDLVSEDGLDIDGGLDEELSIASTADSEDETLDLDSFMEEDAAAEADPTLDLNGLVEDSEPETQPEPAVAEVATPAPASDDLLGDEDDFDFLGETDENATKLDLAKAYIDMGDSEGAKDILNEVISEGNDQQQAEARELMGQVG
ncbi:hypothetical protein Y5S_03514 [Alcanivorax nanhaiticus]|uniref:LysM domain-containing protein n=1 Tax=Alcanivorax nanhaiticus TaxID=1177154 RepID=A0A095SFY7_9GAMM|nr:FimV/HubP family polar landmark protein [Alcanivorax nanhaiticus]KGD63239.1 hypothetical protein Y5S_03514 [Alcanivorax nanhaiticus]